MHAQHDRWQVWYSSSLSRWVASLATTAEHDGGRVYFSTRTDAESFATEKNVQLDDVGRTCACSAPYGHALIHGSYVCDTCGNPL
jgi:hypothetical protein